MPSSLPFRYVSATSHGPLFFAQNIVHELISSRLTPCINCHIEKALQTALGFCDADWAKVARRAYAAVLRACLPVFKKFLQASVKFRRISKHRFQCKQLNYAAICKSPDFLNNQSLQSCVSTPKKYQLLQIQGQ